MSIADPGAPVLPSEFAANYPAFANTTLYPPASVTMYLGLANTMLNAPRWGQMFPLGQMLWAAHFLTLSALDARAVAKGAVSGGVQQVTGSKSVGSVSISYDTAGSQELNAGHWNSTEFGRQFIRFARMAGMGGVQLNGGGPIPGAGGALGVLGNTGTGSL